MAASEALPLSGAGWRPPTDRTAPYHPRVTIRPLRVCSWNHELGVDTSRVYGYRAECTCGWHGHVWDTMKEARAEMRWHRETHERGISWQG